jgi:hypothetical protein
VPGGIGLLIAHLEMNEDPARRNLLTTLGAKPFEVDQITRLVENHHLNPNFKPDSVSKADLISQVYFLYKTSWSNKRMTSFWLVTKNDQRTLGHFLYLDSEITYSVTRYFDGPRDRFFFIHPDYLSLDTPDLEGWIQWFQDNMKISKIPTLARYSFFTNPTKYIFEMSYDFSYILTHWSSSDFLSTLRDHWKSYQYWLEPSFGVIRDPGLEVSWKRLKSKFSAAIVKCKDGSLHNLENCFIPIRQLVDESHSVVPFLDIPEPEHARWEVPQHLGVGIKGDLNFYLKCLEKISGAKVRPQQVEFLL